jgi:hypothetical protein
MPKTFSLEWYQAKVHKVIQKNGPDSAILALLNDKRLKGYDEKIRKTVRKLTLLNEKQLKRHDEQIRKTVREASSWVIEFFKDPRRLAEDKAACKALRESPRGVLVLHVKKDAVTTATHTRTEEPRSHEIVC